MRRKIAVVGICLVIFATGCAEQTSWVAEESISESDVGYCFTYEGNEIFICAEISDIVDVLGECTGYYEAESCAFGGLGKIYTYAHFELDTYSDENVDYISAIVLKDDLVSTQEGICVGDSLERVREIYGEDGIETVGMIAYEKGNMRLCFMIRDNIVASIEYRMTLSKGREVW